MHVAGLCPKVCSSASISITFYLPKSGCWTNRLPGIGNPISLGDCSALGRSVCGVRGCGKSRTAAVRHLAPCLFLQKPLASAIKAQDTTAYWQMGESRRWGEAGEELSSKLQNAKDGGKLPVDVEVSCSTGTPPLQLQEEKWHSKLKKKQCCLAALLSPSFCSCSQRIYSFVCLSNHWRHQTLLDALS